MSSPDKSIAPDRPAQDGRARGRRPLVIGAAAVAAGVVAVLLALFQPWQLFTVTEVHDAVPVVTSSAPAASSPLAASAPAAASPPAASAPAASAGVTELSRGTFVSYEHETTGTARLLRLADGSTVVRLEGFATSNGPDVRVWLSDRPATAADQVASGRWTELGPLRGNRGDLTYPVAAGTDLSGYRSVVVWCRRFSVPFGAAPLTVA